jgi:uncharacterized protein (TIGR00290 family)
MNVVASWSGGKDSCFAYYKAMKAGLNVVSLVTFMESERLSNFHGIRADLLDAQAKAIGLPLAKCVTTPETYEKQFKEALLRFKAIGVLGLVTGDIYEVAGHEVRWLERVCKEIDFVPVRPLWQSDTKQILKDYVAAGFKSTIVRTKLSMLSEEWLGRQLDEKFLVDILRVPNVDPCGEDGEYHTIVTDGPIFKDSIHILETNKFSENGYSRLDIVKFEVKSKNSLGRVVSHVEET